MASPNPSPFTIAARYGLLALLVFTPLARGSVQGWAVTVMEMVTLSALTFFLLEKCLAWEWKWIRTPLDAPLAALIIVTLLSLVFSLHRQSSIRSLIILINYLVIFYLVIHMVRTRSQLRQLIYVIISVAVFLAVFGIFKSFGANPFPWWDYADLKNTYADRLTSTFGCPNHLAGYMEMALPLLLSLFLLGLGPGVALILGYSALLLLAALMLSLSRGGWISTLLSLSFMAGALLASPSFRRKKLLGAIIVGSLVLALIALVSTPVVDRVKTAMEKEEEASFYSRVVAWGGVVDMIADYPLTGIGPGNFKTVFTQYQPPGLRSHFTMAHNDYLHFLSETGLLLIPVIIWMIIALYRKGFNKLKNRSRLVRATTLGAMTGITGILCHSITDFNLHIPANAILFTVLAAIVVAPPPVHHRRADRALGFSAEYGSRSTFNG